MYSVRSKLGGTYRMSLHQSHDDTTLLSDCSMERNESSDFALPKRMRSYRRNNHFLLLCSGQGILGVPELSSWESATSFGSR